MSDPWKFATIGGCAGAVISLSLALCARAFGIVPFAAVDGSEMQTWLVAHPEILVAMESKLQTQQDANDDSARQVAVDGIGLKAFFDPRVAFVAGPANAKTSVVEFFDYNCPYCRASVPAMKKFYEAHRNARFAFIEFPIKGPLSTAAARAAVAARLQPDRYVAFHFALMSEEGEVDEKAVYAVAAKTGLDVRKLKSDMASPAVDRAIDAAHKLAAAAKIDGTPAFIVDGKIREGAMGDDDFAQMTKT
ncbi:MAG TPA: DsbA family protein [Rhizomicrobium sp.]|jgi:protein-disulfide isomerase